MANEIDLYKDLQRVESFYKWCQRKGYKDTMKTARLQIKKITNEIKELYPDLAWER